MLKKSVSFDENKNEIRYYEKEKIQDDYLDTILKYLCTSTDCSDKNPLDDFMILKSGKKVSRGGLLPQGN